MIEQMTSEDLKRLYDKYSNCMSMDIADDGTVIASGYPTVSEVTIDKAGRIGVNFSFSPYDHQKHALVDSVHQAFDGHITGIFTSENAAVAVAKNHAKQIKADRIAQLQREIDDLRSELDDAGMTLSADDATIS